MTYEYDPISISYPVCSTSLQCKLLENESSLISFQDLGLLNFLQNPLFVPTSGSLSSVSRSKVGKRSKHTKGIHPSPSSCKDISETSSSEEEEEEEEETEVTASKRSAWPGTITSLSCKGAPRKGTGGTMKESGKRGTRKANEGRGTRKRKRLPRLSPRASHLLQVLSLLCLTNSLPYQSCYTMSCPTPANLRVSAKPKEDESKKALASYH